MAHVYNHTDGTCVLKKNALCQMFQKPGTKKCRNQTDVQLHLLMAW